MIKKWVREEVEKYSFITSSELKAGYVYFYYQKDGKQKYQKLSYRGTAKQIIKMVENIKQDIGYTEEKSKRDILVRQELEEDKKKQMMFMFV